eukprot:364222-Chlamydomonas_euryale.AAC.1
MQCACAGALVWSSPPNDINYGRHIQGSKRMWIVHTHPCMQPCLCSQPKPPCMHLSGRQKTAECTNKAAVHAYAWTSEDGRVHKQGRRARVCMGVERRPSAQTRPPCTRLHGRQKTAECTNKAAVHAFAWASKDGQVHKQGRRARVCMVVERRSSARTRPTHAHMRT